MFSKHNPRYFEHNPYIEFFTSANQTVRWKIGDPYLKGYVIRSFKFINPKQFVMSNSNRQWFLYEFLPRCRMDDFTFEVCLSTFPTELRNFINQYLKNKEGSHV